MNGGTVVLIDTAIMPDHLELQRLQMRANLPHHLASFDIKLPLTDLLTEFGECR